MSMEIALSLLSGSIPLTALIVKYIPRRLTLPNVTAEIAAITATLAHIQGDIKEIKRELFYLRNRS